MSDGPTNIRNLLETAQRIGSEVNRLKEELADKTVTAETGGGMCTVVANGRGEIVSLTIDPSLLVGGAKMVEDLVMGAVNLALDRAKQMAQDELLRATGGMQLPPGLFGGS